ncbi:MAG: dihydrolipoyl dehydrogenase family protein [Christensenellales bacterium]|jgi:dihydrolipoamide dehydrogenase|nr:FAD-dependent oxidoreductase [Clostridiales bacterium]
MKIIIIGGGPAGYTAAIKAARSGMETVLIEKKALGGTCLNSGCIPTKALLHSSSVFGQAADWGACPQADMDAVHKRSFDIVSRLNKGVEALIKGGGIQYHNSKARLLSGVSARLEDGAVIKGDKILLCTGAKPITLPIMGIEHAKTSDDILSRNYDKFDSVAIIGGGVIGMEFATFFAEMGSRVTIIDVLDTVLSNMSKDIAKYAMLNLKKKGVKFILSSTVKAIRKEGGACVVEYVEKQTDKYLESDLVISCAGRTPTGIEGAEEAGVKFDKGFIVDENGQTTAKNIYAAGDCVKGNIQLAHYAAAQAARLIAWLATGQKPRKIENVPFCVYTSPNAAMAGLKEEDCGFEIEVGRFNTGANGKTLAEDGGSGFVKVIFRKEDQRLVGAQAVCNNACELIGFVANLINMGATREDILNSVYPHPTVSEAFYEAVEDSMGQSTHTIYKR